jgi:hypothetical protein
MPAPVTAPVKVEMCSGFPVAGTRKISNPKGAEKG